MCLKIEKNVVATRQIAGKKDQTSEKIAKIGRSDLKAP